MFGGNLCHDFFADFSVTGEAALAAALIMASKPLPGRLHQQPTWSQGKAD